jgi:hypothetical protein
MLRLQCNLTLDLIKPPNPRHRNNASFFVKGKFLILVIFSKRRATKPS